VHRYRHFKYRKKSLTKIRKKRIYTQPLYVTETHKGPVTFIKSISCKILKLPFVKPGVTGFDILIVQGGYELNERLSTKPKKWPG
jgi:hypothetical protein